MSSHIPLMMRTAVLSGLEYAYYYSAPSAAAKPTLLFLHGFPSCSQDWHHQITHFSGQGYGVLAPDLLGYGGTSKPADVSAYNWRDMCSQINQLLEHEHIEKVIAVGHDLGSWMLSRSLHLHPEKLLGVAFLDVGYSPPGDKFDVEMINRMTKEMTGEEKFRYWDLFCAEDGAKVVDDHPASLVTLMYAADPHIMAETLGPAGKARQWVEQGKEAETGDWLPAEDLKAKIEQFRVGGFYGPLNWYKGLRENISFEDEKAMPKDFAIPTLVIGAGRDEMTPAAFQQQLTQPWVRSQFQFETVDAGHWVMLERPDEVNRLLQDFLDRPLN